MIQLRYLALSKTSLFNLTLLILLLFLAISLGVKEDRWVWPLTAWRVVYLAGVFFVFHHLTRLSGLPKCNADLFRGVFFAALIYLLAIPTLYALLDTPHVLIDKQLAQFDQVLGFDFPAFLKWFCRYPFAQKFFQFFYGSLIWLILASFFVAPLVAQQKTRDLTMMLYVFTFLIGMIIYYFWPAIGPFYAYPQLHYSSAELAVLHEVLAVRDHQMIHMFLGGIISFPSFHVIWALIGAYAFKDKKYLYIPALFWAILIMVSTLTTGWHYLADVLAGTLLMVLALAFVKVIYNYMSIEEPR